MLSRTQRVLIFSNEAESGHSAYQQNDEETGALNAAIIIDKQTYQDLGKPERLTLTIEPGDVLNK